MTKLKILSSLFALLALLYSVALHLGGNFANRSTVCQNTIFRALQPWDSACFYSTIFSKENLLQEVYYEKYRLDVFTTKGGLSPNVKWYKSRFYRQFKEHIDISDSQIDEAHWAYMAAQPHKLEEHVGYLKYLSDSRSLPQTQIALDTYCKKYVKKGASLKEAANSLKWLLEKENLNLNFEFCEKQAGI